MSKQSKNQSAHGQNTIDEQDTNNKVVILNDKESETGNEEEEEEDSSEPEVVTLPPDGRISAEAIYRLDMLLDFVHPRRLKSDLISVLLQYLAHECDSLSADFKETAENYLLLFGWLDFVEKEMDERGFEA